MAADERDRNPSGSRSDLGVFDDPDALAAADERALADISAGRLVAHAAVVRWLEGWGSDDPWKPLRWR